MNANPTIDFASDEASLAKASLSVTQTVHAMNIASKKKVDHLMKTELSAEQPEGFEPHLQHLEIAVTILEDFKSFVFHSLASGRFDTKEEGITEALKLLKCRKAKLDALQSDLQRKNNQPDAEQDTIAHVDLP